MFRRFVISFKSKIDCDRSKFQRKNFRSLKYTFHLFFKCISAHAIGWFMICLFQGMGLWLVRLLMWCVLALLNNMATASASKNFSSKFISKHASLTFLQKKFCCYYSYTLMKLLEFYFYIMFGLLFVGWDFLWCWLQLWSPCFTCWYVTWLSNGTQLEHVFLYCTQYTTEKDANSKLLLCSPPKKHRKKPN